MGSFPYHSHIFRDSYGSGMGIVWEAYHKGVPLLGVPENPIDYIIFMYFVYIYIYVPIECLPGIHTPLRNDSPKKNP